MKLRYNKKEFIPLKLRDYYIQKGSKFVLKAAEPLMAQSEKDQQQIAKFRIERQALEEVAKIAVPRPGTFGDIAARASETFHTAPDGVVEAIGKDGKPIYDHETGRRLTIEDWAASLATDEEAAHLFSATSVVKKQIINAQPKRELDDLEKLATETIDASNINGEIFDAELVEKIASGEIKAI